MTGALYFASSARLLQKHKNSQNGLCERSVEVPQKGAQGGLVGDNLNLPDHSAAALKKYMDLVHQEKKLLLCAGSKYFL